MRCKCDIVGQGLAVSVWGQTVLPFFASANNDEGADDDADESYADSHSDPRHWLLVQMVEAIRKGCKTRRSHVMAAFNIIQLQKKLLTG